MGASLRLQPSAVDGEGPGSRTEHGLPWFDLHDEHLDDVKPSGELQKVKTVKEKDEEKGFEPQQDDRSIDIPDDQVVKYSMGWRKVAGGSW